MADSNTVGTNTFTLIELATTDLSAAEGFYGELFGWKTKEMDLGVGCAYAEANVDGKSVARLYELDEQMRKNNVPPHWMSYVRVEDVDAKAEKARELGGTVVHGPFDVPDMGRMAVVTDPTGATFSLWQSKEQPGAMLFNQPGSLTWNELLTNDVDAAKKFYTGLFGWKAATQDMGGMNYTVFMNGERAAGGLMAITEEMGPMPPNWSVYIAVDDADRAAKTAGTHGAKILVEPREIPEVGKFATLQDPQGAVFTVMKLNQAPDN